MSCSVMVPMRAGHDLQPFRTYGRPVRQMLRIVRPASPASRLRHGSLLSIHLRPAFPAAGASGKRVPVSRVSRARACVPGCARFAAARYARPIARAKGGAPGTLAICHGMSCSPCAPGMIYSRFGHTAAMSGSCSGSSVRPSRHRVFGMGPSSRSVFVLRSPPPGSSALFRAVRVRACAPGCARFAAARYARLIARARRRSGSSVRPPRHRILGMGPSSRSVFVRHSPPPGSRALFRAYRVCVRARPAARVSRRRGSRA